MEKTSRGSIVFASGLVAVVLLSACKGPRTTAVDDGGGRRPEDFPEIAADVFKPLDGGIALASDEIKGRNTWNLWTGGNEQFWDRMSRESFGLMDLLKTVDSRQRAKRFEDMGLINQPGYRQATKPDEYGLWIDEAVEPEAREAQTTLRTARNTAPRQRRPSTAPTPAAC